MAGLERRVGPRTKDIACNTSGRCLECHNGAVRVGRRVKGRICRGVRRRDEFTVAAAARRGGTVGNCRRVVRSREG